MCSFGILLIPDLCCVSSTLLSWCSTHICLCPHAWMLSEQICTGTFALQPPEQWLSPELPKDPAWAGDPVCTTLKPCLGRAGAEGKPEFLHIPFGDLSFSHKTPAKLSREHCGVSQQHRGILRAVAGQQGGFRVLGEPEGTGVQHQGTLGCCSCQPGLLTQSSKEPVSSDLTQL